MTTPTTIQQPFEEAPRPSRWPKAIGVISLLYALGGVTCYTVYGGYLFAAPKLPEMFRQGMDFPPLVRLVGLVEIAFTLVLGVLMLTGAINLLRRRRSGVTRLKRWAVLRLILLVFYLLFALGTSKAQLVMLRQANDFKNQMLRESGQGDRARDPSDAELWRQFLVQTVILTGLLTIYPVFLGLYLSRRKITAEVETWE